MYNIYARNDFAFGHLTKALGGASMTKIITLTQGQITKVSDHRFEYLNQWKWFAWFDENAQSFRAVRTDYSTGKQKRVYMARDIMNTPKGMKCDHVNGDTLDNQDDNLRNCTNSQNCMNKKAQSNNTSGYKGVCKNGNNWRAEVQVDGKVVFNKTFKSIKDAAHAYDEAARKYHGEFARTNL